MKLKRRSLAVYAMLILFPLFAGCSGGGGSGIAGSAGTGTLSLHLTDAATSEYRAVYVTIDRVDVHFGHDETAPNPWKTVATPAKTYNLLDLVNGALERLGLTELETGDYTQMRLIIGSSPDGTPNILGDPHPHANYIILANTNQIHELKVPSGPQTGIKIIDKFAINDNQETDLILDFDAGRSVVKAGKSGMWLLKPTIKVLHSKALSILEGTVADQDGKPVKGALVSAQVGDPSAGDPRDKVVIEAASPTNENGWFKILVRPGTYNVVAYKDTYAFDFECGVHVEAGETIVLGDFQLNDLESANGPDYGFVEGDVVVAGGGSAAISFRIPGCAGEIEVKAVGIDSGGSYKEILPVGTYEVLAWSEGKDTELHPGVEVESASSTFVDIDM